ncbi:hypothetical protein D3C78_836050 [compost metagenome]
MRHHRVVDQGDAQALAIGQAQRLGIAELDAVERPGEFLHVPGQVQLKGARRFASVRVGEGAFEVGIGQYTAAVVAQADAWVGELGAGAHGLHVHQRVVGFRGRVGLHGVAHAGHAAVVHAAHLAMVHACHRAMIHAHVGHADQRSRVGAGHCGAEPLAQGQGAPGKTAAVHGLGKQGVGPLVARLDDHVIGLRHGNPQFIDADRLHVLSVGGDDSHFQTGQAHVEVTHGRAVDQPQAQFLSRFERAGPVGLRGLAVHQVAVGHAADICQVRGAHLHFGPHRAVCHRGRPAVAADVLNEVAHGALVSVVVVGLFFQGVHQVFRGLVAPVAEHHHVVAVVLEGFRLAGVDHQRSIDPGLLLKARVAVVPVGTVLVQREAVFVEAVGGDALETQAWHAIHVGRQDDPVPMNRGVLLQPVTHANGHGVALAPAQQRAGNATVDGHGGARGTGEIDRCFADPQVELATAQRGGLIVGSHGPGRRSPQARARQ